MHTSPGVDEIVTSANVGCGSRLSKPTGLHGDEQPQLCHKKSLLYASRINISQHKPT